MKSFFFPSFPLRRGRWVMQLRYAVSCLILFSFAPNSQGKEESSFAASSWRASSGGTGNNAVPLPGRVVPQVAVAGPLGWVRHRGDCWNNFCSVFKLFRMQLHRDFPSPEMHSAQRNCTPRIARLSLPALSLHLTFPARWIQDLPVNFNRKHWQISWRHVPAGFGHKKIFFL